MEDAGAAGVWGRFGRGEWEGIEDRGWLQVGIRVEGGPWVLECCDVVSGRGVPLFVDDPEAVMATFAAQRAHRCAARRIERAPGRAPLSLLNLNPET